METAVPSAERNDVGPHSSGALASPSGSLWPFGGSRLTTQAFCARNLAGKLSVRRRNQKYGSLFALANTKFKRINLVFIK
jgi:hypothetical protein